MSMLYDIILVVIIAMCLLRGFHTGAAGMALLLVGWAVAAVIIITCSQPLAERIYDTVVQPIVVDTVEDAVPDSMSDVMVQSADAMDGVQDILDSLEGILGGQIIDRTAFNSMRDMLRSGGDDVADGIEKTVFRPLFTGLLRGALSILIVCVVMNVVRFFSRGSYRRRRGLLGLINRLLGAVVGTLIGVGWGYVYAIVLYAVSGLFHSALLSSEIVEQTMLVSMFL